MRLISILILILPLWHDAPLMFDPYDGAASFYVRYDKYCFSDTVDLIEICEGDSVLIADEYRFTNGIYTEHFPTPSGCDSLINYPLFSAS